MKNKFFKKSGAADNTGIIVVDVETQNYEDITITVNVTLIDQITVTGQVLFCLTFLVFLPFLKLLFVSSFS